MFNPFEASNSVKVPYLLILECNPDFSKLVGTRKLVNSLAGDSKQQV